MPGLSGLSNHSVERSRRFLSLTAWRPPEGPSLSVMAPILTPPRAANRPLGALCDQSYGKSINPRRGFKPHPSHAIALAFAPVAQLDRVCLLYTSDAADEED